MSASGQLDASLKTWRLPVVAAVALLVALYGALLVGVRALPWHDAVVLPLVLGAAVGLFAGLLPRRRFAAIFGVAGAILLLELMLVWKVGYAGRNHVFAGFFPLSDAGAQYWDAERAAHGVTMSASWARRPLPVALLATLLRICHSLEVALAVIALAWAGAVALFTAEVWRSHGPRAAALVLVLLVMFARRYVGFVQCEGVGGPLGLAALALLWRAASQRASAQPWRGAFMAGMLLLTLALASRPGPFLVLGGLAAWAARADRGRARLVTLASSTGVVAAALLANAAVQRVLAPGTGYSDLPGIVYGLVHGEDHNYFLRTQPWAEPLSQAERWSGLFGLLGRELTAHPWLLPAALFKSVAAYLYLPQGLFGFVWHNPDDRVLEAGGTGGGVLASMARWGHELGWFSVLNAAVMAVLAVGFVVGVSVAVVKARKQSRDPHVALLLWALAGIVATMPVLPPWITEGAQIHAAVYGVWVAFLAVCLVGKPTGQEAISPITGRLPVAVVAAASVVLAVGLATPYARPGGACGPGDARVVHLDLARATYGKGPRERFALADVRANLAQLRTRNAPFADAIEKTLVDANVVVPAYDTCAEQMTYLVDAGGLLGEEPWQQVRFEPLGAEPLYRVLPP